MRSITATCVIFLLAAASALAQGNGSSAPSEGTSAATISPGSIITMEQALGLAAKSGLQTQLNELNLEIARSANAQVHAQSSIGLSGNAGVSRTTPFGAAAKAASGATISALAGTVATDAASAGVSLAVPNGGASPTTNLSLKGTQSLSETDPIYHQTSVTASINQTIWDGYPGFRNRINIGIADVTLQQKVLAAEAAAQTLLYQVKQSYYSVASAQDAVALDTKILTQRERDYAQTKTLYDAGQATAVDLQQADVNRYSAELDLNDANSALKESQVSLSLLMGVPPESQYSVQAPSPLSPPVQSLQQLTDTALRQRVDLQQILLTSKINSLQTTYDKTASSPVVTANAGITYGYIWNNSQDTGSWNAGVQVTVPIVDSGTAAAQVQQAKLQQRSTDIQIAQLKQTIAQTVQTDYDSVRSLSARVNLAQQNLSVSQRQYQLTEIQFRQGTKSQLDVLTAAVTSSTAETALQKAKTQLQLAIIKLANDLGE
ncbi:MAG TPA: TolC family protein [Spirochaetia bacterium]|nr:TolC family protein [Spirochaetia bacterium]